MDGVLTMVDRETGSVWTHLDGKAISGEFQGARMTMLPLVHITWEEWKVSHPDTMVLSPDTPFQQRYGPVRIGVFNQREAGFGDARLDANALVVGVEVNGHFKGYSVKELANEGGVVNDTLDGQPIVVFYDDVAQVGLAYSRALGDRILEFEATRTTRLEIRDKETNSIWDHQGKASSGSLAGASLEFAPSFISEWYGWSGYHPGTELYQEK